ncbi:hypothetical protein KUF71_018790 [Frankliniella fusca]|uniref:Uncharacterized protein n=1 Tax=Frankliniella fusca TaxID=407009 RepID=A0AAE1GRY1_9NEOP|nr:hypothetical protein KUF71_018790 [Frankliniella fusca]
MCLADTVPSPCLCGLSPLHPADHPWVLLVGRVCYILAVFCNKLEFCHGDVWSSTKPQSSWPLMQWLLKIGNKRACNLQGMKVICWIQCEDFEAVEN